jgi:cell division protein FtsW
MLKNRTDISELGRWWWTIDRAMLGAIIVLAMLGVMLVSSASPPVAERLGLSSFYFVNRHLFFLVPSLLILVAVSMLSPLSIWRLSALGFLGACVLTLSTKFLGYEIKGATRWIHIMGFSLQPSEFLKPTMAIVSAWLIARQMAEPQFKGYIYSGLALAVSAFLLIIQPDIGMTFVLTVIWAAQIFIAGLPLMFIALMAALFVGGLFGAYLFFPHFTSRMDRFLDPNSGDNYQVQKSLEAFQEGGIFGTGPGHGTVKLRLPDAHADFIFSVMGEEFGFITAFILILIFLFIILRALKAARASEDLFIILAVGGLITQFAIQGFIHMGSSLQLLPAKGMTLPFISYGGSSLLGMGFAMGAVLALTRRRTDRQDQFRQNWIGIDARPIFGHDEAKAKQR